MMVGDELFRQNSGSESEKIIVDAGRGKPRAPEGPGGKTGFNQINDRMVRVSKGASLFGDANLEGNRIARNRSLADLKAELETASEMTPVGWNLKPWKPSTLSRHLLVRVQDAGSSVENVLQVTKSISERVAVLCGEVKQIDSDEESLDV